MVKTEISYEVIQSEFDGLLVRAKKDANVYKLYISRELIGENGLEIWNFHEANYYNNFLDENIEAFIHGVGEGNHRKFSDGYEIN